MADKPRPPMASLDAAWDEDTALPSKRGVPTPPPPAVQRTRTGTALMPRPDLDAAPGETAVLPADELDVLVGRTSSPFGNTTSETLALEQSEIDQILEHDQRQAPARVPSAPPPPPTWGLPPPAQEDAADGRGEPDIWSARPLGGADEFAYAAAPTAARVMEDDVSDAFGRMEMDAEPDPGAPVGPLPPPTPPPPRPPPSQPTPGIAVRGQPLGGHAMAADPAPYADVDFDDDETPFGAPPEPRGFAPPLGGLFEVPPGTTGASPPIQQMAPPIEETAPLPPMPPMSFGASPFGAEYAPVAAPSTPQHTPVPHAYAPPAPPAAPASAPRAPVPSPRSSASRMTIVFLSGAAVVLSIATVVLKRVLYGPKRDRAQVSGLVLPPGAPQPPPVGPVDDEVREALQRLKEGIKVCVRTNIRVLPGTSPAVPPSLGAMVNGVYASSASDWKTPVWACSKFSASRPQRFQIQWQQEKILSQGMGVAWIDDDADGKADRAFRFRATLKKRGDVEVGEIEPFDAKHPVAAPR